MGGEVAQTAHGVGNTVQPRVRKRRWCFTLNNHTDEELAQIHKGFGTAKYIMGDEIGANGTRHVQGYVEFKNPRSLSALKKTCKRAHWEPARGNRKDNQTYCSKEKVIVCTLPVDIRVRVLEQYKDVVWRQWQQQVLKIVNGLPDNRTFHWFWEHTGNVGKSYLAKYIYLTKRTIIADGKKDNVFNQIKTYMDEHEDDPQFDVVLLDIPRYNLEYINYGMLEQIKNGLIYSGKYEGGVCLFDNVHLIIFANEPPDTSRLSFDRWNVIAI